MIKGEKTKTKNPFRKIWIFSFFTFFAFLTSVAMLTGCGGVASTKSIKPSLPDTIKKISIPLVSNRSLKYGMEADFTDALVRQFQKDGRLMIVPEDQCDAKLVVTVENYIKEPVQRDVNNVPILYNLKVHVSLKLLDAKTQNILQSKDRVGGLSGIVVSFAVSPQTGLDVSTELEAQRKAFENLSRDIVNVVIYGWEKF